MPRSIPARWQTVEAYTTSLLAVSCIAWLGLLVWRDQHIEASMRLLLMRGNAKVDARSELEDRNRLE